jgi:hypothetical protein
MTTQQKTRGDYLRELLDEYLKIHGSGPVDLNAVYFWAVQNRRYEPPATSQARIFREEMARAAREDHYTDPQGRHVRKKHAVVIQVGDTQRSLWADIETAPLEHMRLSFQQRRQSIFGDVTQLKTDMDSYNENHNPTPDRPIQLSFNFDEDLKASEEEDWTYEDGLDVDPALKGQG